ncbi:hypothetical protein L6452_19426 [Arctium lappa]|uniref:Uncharacterized protein n=1 Tax=Arctium lappa TaxID=4217 RepID=A0ACB9B843_ARCLA|nr:hypothetical protein L6452_19426 [Arctium lappa]
MGRGSLLRDMGLLLEMICSQRDGKERVWPKEVVRVNLLRFDPKRYGVGFVSSSLMIMFSGLMHKGVEDDSWVTPRRRRRNRLGRCRGGGGAIVCDVEKEELVIRGDG